MIWDKIAAEKLAAALAKTGLTIQPLHIYRSTGRRVLADGTHVAAYPFAAIRRKGHLVGQINYEIPVKGERPCPS